MLSLPARENRPGVGLLAKRRAGPNGSVFGELFSAAPFNGCDHIKQEEKGQQPALQGFGQGILLCAAAAAARLPRSLALVANVVDSAGRAGR